MWYNFDPKSKDSHALRSAIVSRLKITAKLNIAERLTQDGSIRLAVRGTEVDFRVSTTADPKRMPPQAPNGTKLQKNPRCPVVDSSTRKIEEVVYSPPTDNPRRNRISTSTEAQIPIS
jgi:hypothetical protein